LVLKTNVVGASSLTPEGWSRSILDFGLEGAGEPIEEVDATLPGCASDGQHSFHESAAAFTVGTEGYFPPEHGLADSELGDVVGGHGSVSMKVGPKAIPLPDEILGCAPGLLGYARLLQEDGQPLPHLVLDRSCPPDQLVAGDLLPLELVPQMEDSVAGQLQHAALGSGFAHALQHALEISPDVAVAELVGGLRETTQRVAILKH